jgi:hypothetical protein
MLAGIVKEVCDSMVARLPHTKKNRNVVYDSMCVRKCMHKSVPKVLLSNTSIICIAHPAADNCPGDRGLFIFALPFSSAHIRYSSRDSIFFADSVSRIVCLRFVASGLFGLFDISASVEQQSGG